MFSYVRALRFVNNRLLCKALHTMKISEEQLALVLRPSVLRLSAIFARHQHELRVAGGAVRDLLRGLVPHDLDFATTATPDEMKKMFEEEGVRMINETGEKHGTVTARIEDENFECTTLRIDIKTDGRHAVVRFTKDWYLDSNRRDLTINSMFLGMDGTVYDYFNGKQHLDERRVEFVGDPDKRIQEDYLRILRYFRFYGRIAKSSDGHSASVLECITRNAEGLARISGERIWSELQKIIVGNYGGQLVQKMIDCNLGPHIGLPDDFSGSECRSLCDRCSACGIDPHALQPMTILAAGFNNVDDAFNFIARVKCSKKERELLVFILDHRGAVIATKDIKILQDLLADMVIDQKVSEKLARNRLEELLKYACQMKLLEDLNSWNLPAFPVVGGVLVSRLDDKRKTRLVTKELFELWKQSNFSATQDELLLHVDEIQANIKLVSKGKKK
ncbi:Poly A polymerase head domain [Trinorchestia longiramus]|nr:Poly A polymerase head domain [Trinorchestia longiramus]